MNDTFTGIEALITKKGLRIEMDTNYCKAFLKDHDSCIGCESEEGCKRYAGVMSILTESMLYKPASYEDMVKTNRAVQKKIHKAINREGSI